VFVGGHKKDNAQMSKGDHRKNVAYVVRLNITADYNTFWDCTRCPNCWEFTNCWNSNNLTTKEWSGESSSTTTNTRRTISAVYDEITD